MFQQPETVFNEGNSVEVFQLKTFLKFYIKLFITWCNKCSIIMSWFWLWVYWLTQFNGSRDWILRKSRLSHVRAYTEICWKGIWPLDHFSIFKGNPLETPKPLLISFFTYYVTSYTQNSSSRPHHSSSKFNYNSITNIISFSLTKPINFQFQKTSHKANETNNPE